MKYVLLMFFLASSTLFSSETEIHCTHIELCKLADSILNQDQVKSFKLEVIVSQTGDPHDFEPSSKEIKILLSVPILIMGPVELNPWMRSIEDKRKKSRLITIELPVTNEEKNQYIDSTNETIAHFWLYPKAWCSKKEQLQNKLESLKLKFKSNKACFYEVIESKLKSSIQSINMPVIISHDALLPLFKTYTLKKQNIIAIKGSNHHEETSAQTIKKLHSLLGEKKVLWLLEKDISFPANIKKLIRKNDFVVYIDTNNNQNKNQYYVLESLNKELEDLIKKQ